MSTAFGTFLELSVPTGDIRASLAFYRRLGFTELGTNDIRTHYYAVVTDGHIAIGLHGGGLEEPALAFVRPDLARHARAMVQAGRELEFMRLDPEQFNEAGLRSPDGQLLLMLEARTFSPGEDDDAPPTRIGRFTELVLPASDPAATRAFYEEAGFLASEDEASGEVLLTTEGLAIALTPVSRGQRFTIDFAAADPAQVLRDLAALDIGPQRQAGALCLQAPEGTRLVIG